MTLTSWFKSSQTFTSPPPGSINVLVGKKVEGPGGAWVPCATLTAEGDYYSGLFQIGPGKRQVCAANAPHVCPNVALSRAIELASAAAS